MLFTHAPYIANFLRDDRDGINDGIRLTEEESPAEQYASFSDLIRIYNSGLGWCTRCSCVLSDHIEVRRPQSSGVDEAYGQMGRAWTGERLENYLVHLKSNLLSKPICK